MSRIEYDTNGGCWLWSGNTVKGYGSIGVDGGKQKAHRLAYALWCSAPDGLEVCHKCDVPACCNPDHLFLGTHAENMADMQAKGRRRRSETLPRGEAHHHTTLSSEQIREIRSLAAERVSQTIIGARFGISQQCVSDIVRRRTWGHLPPPTNATRVAEALQTLAELGCELPEPPLSPEAA